MEPLRPTTAHVEQSPMMGIFDGQRARWNRVGSGSLIRLFHWGVDVPLIDRTPSSLDYYAFYILTRAAAAICPLLR
jgi:hypothetical protein